MTPKELLDNAIKYTGQDMEGVFEKNNNHYVIDSNGRELIVYPGDYLVQDNVHKLTFEVIRSSNVKTLMAAIGYQTRDGGES